MMCGSVDERDDYNKGLEKEGPVMAPPEDAVALRAGTDTAALSAASANVPRHPVRVQRWLPQRMMSFYSQ